MCIRDRYQERRWDGDFETVKKIVQSGRLGTIVEYELSLIHISPEEACMVRAAVAELASGL